MNNPQITGPIVENRCPPHAIKLRSGRYFDLQDPQPDQFTFQDIAGGLSKICRFAGQLDRWYSVAEHCLQCEHIAVSVFEANDAEILAVLLHDAAEAFLGDVAKPLKSLLPDYQRIEARLEQVIWSKYHVDMAAHRELVRKVDVCVLHAERRALLLPDQVYWPGEQEMACVRIIPRHLGWIDAEQSFLWYAEHYGINVTK